MKHTKTVLILTFSAVVLFVGGYALGSHTAHVQADALAQAGQSRAADEYGLILYANGEYLSSDMLYLWENANNLYDVDYTEQFKLSASGTFLSDSGPEFYEVYNYDEVVDAYFTPRGKAQLEQTTLGGSCSLIEKQGDKVYRMGAWKTGYSYAAALDGFKVVSADGDTLVLKAKYKMPGSPEEPPVFGYASFTVTRVDDTWYVDDYVYPEAQKQAERKNPET